MDKNSLQQFQKFLTAVSDEIKSQKKPLEESVNLNEITQPTETINKESHIDQVAKYLSLKTKQTYNAQIKNEEVQIPPQDIESQRWKDPLVQDKNFVTFKEMNDHYGLFLQRIQQQMSTMGGGGEVNFSRLDDINSASVGLNKYLTYDQVTKKFEFDNIGISDGLYLNGDNEITLAIASTSQLGGIKTGTAFEIDGSDKLQLKVATETDLGGIRLGPGVTVNGQDQIIIDSSGLDFSFGDFSATVGQYSSNTDYAVLSAINEDEDIIIASNGAGKIQIVGEFKVHPTNGFLTDTLEDNPIFSVGADGQVKILVPAIDSIAGAVSIVGSTTGEFISPVNTGVMLHVTGQASSPPIPSRIYNDSQNSFAAFVARRFNGSVASPTAVLDNEEIMRISGTAHDGTTIPGAGNTRILYRALGDQTITNHGGAIELWTTPVDSVTLTKVATIDNADGITSTKFTGPLTGNVTGNADTATTATNLAAASSILTGSLSVDPVIINRASASVQTFTLSGLTTNHKIVVTFGTAIGHGVFISAAWASATNTLSIEFQNFLANQDIDLTAKSVQYFAWV